MLKYICVFVLLSLLGCSASVGNPMVEGNGVSWTEEVLNGMNAGDHSVLMQYIDDDTVIAIGGHKLLPFAGTYHGKEGMLEYSTIMRMSEAGAEDREGGWACTLVGSDIKTGVLSCNSENFTFKKTGKSADFLDIAIIIDWNVATGMIKKMQGFSGDSTEGIEAYLTKSELNVEMLKKLMVTDLLKMKMSKEDFVIADSETLAMFHDDIVIEVTNLYPSSLNVKIEGKEQLVDLFESMKKKDFSSSILPEATQMQLKALKLLMPKKHDNCPEKRYLPSPDGDTTAIVQAGSKMLKTMIFDEEDKLKSVSVKLDQNLISLRNIKMEKEE